MQTLRLPAFNCLQEAQSQLQHDTSSAGAPAWLVKPLVGCKARWAHKEVAGKEGSVTGSFSALPGRCTENPKSSGRGRGGVACTVAAAVVGSDAVWVEAALFGCWVVVWVALQGWGRVFALVFVCWCVCSCAVCVSACDVSVVCVVVWLVRVFVLVWSGRL